MASLMGVDGKTTGEVVDNVKNVLTQSGLPQNEVEKFMYTLNDELMQHGTVVDQHPDLAPGGYGRDVAATHQAETEALQNIQDLAAFHGENLASLKGMSDHIMQSLQDLNEGPIQRLTKEEMSKQARADRLEARKLASGAKRLASLQYRRDAINSLIERANAERDLNLEAVRALTEDIAKKVGKETPEDLNGQMQLLRDVAGLRTTANGVDSLVLDKGVKFLLGTKAEPLYKGVAAIDDPVAIWDLTRGKLPVEMCQDLADRKSTRLNSSH